MKFLHSNNLFLKLSFLFVGFTCMFSIFRLFEAVGNLSPAVVKTRQSSWVFPTPFSWWDGCETALQLQNHFMVTSLQHFMFVTLLRLLIRFFRCKEASSSCSSRSWGFIQTSFKLWDGAVEILLNANCKRFCCHIHVQVHLLRASEIGEKQGKSKRVLDISWKYRRTDGLTVRSSPTSWSALLTSFIQ